MKGSCLDDKSEILKLLKCFDKNCGVSVAYDLQFLLVDILSLTHRSYLWNGNTDKLNCFKRRQLWGPLQGFMHS